MKLRLFLGIIFLSVLQTLTAQETMDTAKTHYALIVSFQSHCCGVPTETSLRNFIASYKKKYRIKKISANRIGPMGREGEYYLAFKLTELNKKQAKDFISKVKKIKLLKEDKGSLSFKEKEEIDATGLPQRAVRKTIDF